jgi:hypothetical protein
VPGSSAKIGRAPVSTVVNGVLYAVLDLTAKPSAKKLAETWADNVIGQCRGARMELGPKEVTAIRAWVGAGCSRSRGRIVKRGPLGRAPTSPACNAWRRGDIEEL